MLAAWALWRELAGLSASDLVRELRDFGTADLALGVLCTLASFASLGLIERLALHYLRRDRVVPGRTAMVTAFVANAFSQSIGVALLTGTAVRLRAYERRGLDTADVARITTFATLTAALGLLAAGGLALLATSTPLVIMHRALPMQFIGAALLGIVVSYLAWSCRGGRDTIGRGVWRLTRPAPRTATRQIVLSSFDWVLTGAVLFLALPAGVDIGFGTMLRVYLVAQTVAMLSHVPGGAGVFELMVVALLRPVIAPEQRVAVVAALVAFRVLYYLIPLGAAMAIAAWSELLPSRRVLILEMNAD